MRSLIVCVLAVSSVLAFPADTNTDNKPSGGCPGGYTEGQEVTRQRLVFACRGGQIVPAGCIAEDLSKIPVGQHFDNTHYRRQCEQRGNDLTFDAVACVSNGQEHRIGDTWDDGTNFYTCKSNGVGQEPELEAVSQGCVEGGKRVNQGDSVTKGDQVYECKPSVNKKYKLAQAGCVKDGKQLKAGETVEVGKYWFNCTRYGQTVVLKPGGCVSNGKRLNDGDRFPDGDVLYECRVDPGRNEIIAVACIQHDASGSVVERKLGCSWIEGQEPLQYEYTCKHDSAANTATKVQVRCTYKVGNGAYNIEPGCYRLDNKNAIGCLNQGSTLNLQLFQGENGEQSAKSAGLRSC